MESVWMLQYLVEAADNGAFQVSSKEPHPTSSTSQLILFIEHPLLSQIQLSL